MTHAPQDPAGAVTRVRDRLRAGKASSLAHGVFLLVLVDFVIITTICLVLAPRRALLMLPLLLVAPVVVMGLINLVAWAPWARRYPARPQSADAVVKPMQSFLLGRFWRINNAVHLAADDEHLHLIPFFLLRLGGARVISLPWSSITDVGPPARFGLTRARLDGRPMAGPEWALAIARGAGAPAEASPAEPAGLSDRSARSPS